jgi:SH3-like domain-containing protein
MRKGPGQRHKLVVSIPAGSGGVVGTGRCSAPDDGMSRHKWCEVTWKGYRGWVSKGGLIRVR